MKKIGFLIFCLLQLACTSQPVPKINGVSFVASGKPATQENVTSIEKVNANHAAVMPFGFIRAINTPTVIFNSERQWFGETEKGASQYIDLLHKNGISVMLKPQLWIMGGEFTGTLSMETEQDWKVLENTYREFIITYAKLADAKKVAIFCIGTELEQFIAHRPEYWKQLITEVKQLYNGQLTYAANWDEYTQTPFWEALDYIGIDAYFPLSEEQTPSVESLKIRWQKWKQEMAAFSKEKSTPIIFTEFGYRSIDYTTKIPWSSHRQEGQVNLKAQVNATKAIIDEFWSEKWFVGGYVWKWFIDHKNSGGVMDNRFTPQNKPAENTIRELYK